MLIHIGTSGWFYSHWRGIFYPALEPTPKLWFTYYANVFRTVELNAPFYRWPKPATVRRWARDAPPGFRYSVKVNRTITHEKRLKRTRALVDDYLSLATTLGEKMGCFLFQFPPSFHYSAARLRAIVTQLATGAKRKAQGAKRSDLGESRFAPSALRPPTDASRSAPVVVEFRHKSWWCETVYAALTGAGIGFVAVSAPRLPEAFPPGQPVLYVRLSGRTRWYRHDYSNEELCAWADRILASKAKEAWVYFNNDREGHAVKNALALRRMLRAESGIEVR